MNSTRTQHVETVAKTLYAYWANALDDSTQYPACRQLTDLIDRELEKRGKSRIRSRDRHRELTTTLAEVLDQQPGNHLAISLMGPPSPSSGSNPGFLFESIHATQVNMPQGDNRGLTIQAPTSSGPHEPQASTPRADTRVRLLIVAADPKGVANIHTAAEIRDLRATISRTVNRDRLMIEDRLATRLEDLQHALVEVQPDILHIAGHGTGADIALERDDRMQHLFDKERLGNLLHNRGIRLLFLNICLGAQGLEALQERVGTIIGPNTPIGDSKARKFATFLYTELMGSRTSVDDAFIRATATLLSPHPWTLVHGLEDPRHIGFFP